MSSGERKRNSPNHISVLIMKIGLRINWHGQLKMYVVADIGVREKMFACIHRQGREDNFPSGVVWKDQPKRVIVPYAKGVMSLRFSSKVPWDS